MNDKVRKILGGMSAASLIVAGSLPLLGQNKEFPSSCTQAKSKKVESRKTDKTKAKDKVGKTTPEKTAPTKAKTSK